MEEAPGKATVGFWAETDTGKGTGWRKGTTGSATFQEVVSAAKGERPAGSSSRHAEHQARPQVGDANWKPGEDPGWVPGGPSVGIIVPSGGRQNNGPQ